MVLHQESLVSPVSNISPTTPTINPRNFILREPFPLALFSYVWWLYWGCHPLFILLFTYLNSPWFKFTDSCSSEETDSTFQSKSEAYDLRHLILYILSFDHKDWPKDGQVTKPESLNLYSRILGHRLIFMLGMNKYIYSPESCWYPFRGLKDRSNTTECRVEKWKEIKS